MDEKKQLQLRLPDELHDALVRAREESGRSLNAEIVKRLADSFVAVSLEKRLAAVERQVKDLAKKR